MDLNLGNAGEPAASIRDFRQAAQARPHNAGREESGQVYLSALGHDMDTVLDRQRQFFMTGQTRSYEFRRQQLLRLKHMIRKQEAKLNEVLMKDLGKFKAHAFATEIGMVQKEISYQLRNLKKMMKPIRVSTPLISGLGKSRIFRQPKGQVLIVSPWNYPVYLLLSPLVGAVAAGNTVVLKPSELAPASSKFLARLIEMTFDERHVAIFEGPATLSQALLTRSWDHVFFTGSTRVGRMVAEAAAKNLTPVTLELGGKSPCILSSKANLDVSIRRIIWGKFVNCGQTCVAPDYLLIEDKIYDRAVELLKQEIAIRFGTNPRYSEDYSRIINRQHLQRLLSYIHHDPGKVSAGGDYDLEERYLAPTLLEGIDENHPVMGEEIFGPILPIFRYSQFDQLIRSLQEGPRPLAFYLFSEDRVEVEKVIQNLSFGGGCVNDTLMHLTNPGLPFGGVRESGMGAYHGKHSFETFSHSKGMLLSSTAVDPVIRYSPLRAWKLRILRFFMR